MNILILFHLSSKAIATIRLPNITLLPYHIALLCIFLSKSTKKWKFLDFGSNVMGDIGVKILANILLSNRNIMTYIEILSLVSNCLTSQSATDIINIIREGTLVELNLSCNNLDDDGMIKILQALQANSKLTILVLTFNDIGVNGAKSIGILLCHNRTLKHLYIGTNKLMDDGVTAISEQFKISEGNRTNLPCIKSLDLSANDLTSHSETAVSIII